MANTATISNVTVVRNGTTTLTGQAAVNVNYTGSQFYAQQNLTASTWAAVGTGSLTNIQSYFLKNKSTGSIVQVGVNGSGSNNVFTIIPYNVAFTWNVPTGSVQYYMKPLTGQASNSASVDVIIFEY